MKRFVACVVVVLSGAFASPALADHPDEGAVELTPAVERVLGDETFQASSGVLKVPLDDGTVLRTHGPDPDVSAAEAPEALFAEGPSDRFFAGSSERAPICATDYAMQVLYARSPSSPDRLAASTPAIQSIVRRSNHVLNSEAVESGGGGGDYKVICDGSGGVSVQSFTTTDTTFGAVVNAAKAAGHSSSRRNYAIFLDEAAPGNYCGVGSLYYADSPGLANPHNTDGGYALIYKGCWEGTTFMHEVGHNRGAVQQNAPDSTGTGSHCNEGRDVMCYAPDGGDRNQSMVYPCSTLTRFDCNFDTYFDAAPEPGEYLANFWNLGRQGQNFLAISPSEPEPEPEREQDTIQPEIAITFMPGTRTSRRSARFAFTGTDDTSTPEDLVFECSLDRGVFEPCFSPQAYRGLSRSGHLFEVRAADEAGNVDETPARYRWRVLP